MLHFLPFHSRSLALAVRFDPLNSIHTRQSFLKSSGNSQFGWRNWSQSFFQSWAYNLRTENTTATCQRFISLTYIPCPPLKPDENRAVLASACCKSLLLHQKYANAEFDHFVPRKSFVAVAGSIAFFKGMTSCLFDLGLTIQLVKYFSVGAL